MIPTASVGFGDCCTLVPFQRPAVQCCPPSKSTPSFRWGSPPSEGQTAWVQILVCHGLDTKTVALFQSGKWGEVLPISWPFLSPRFLPLCIFSLPPQLQKHSQGWTWWLHVLRMEVSTQCLLSSVPWLLLVLHTCSSGLLVLCLPLINSASAQDCPVWLLQLALEDPD